MARIRNLDCPSCGNRVGSYALETGPVHVWHTWRDRRTGKSCHGEWIVVPDSDRPVGYHLIPVRGRAEVDTVLRQQTEQWVVDRAVEHEQRVREAIESVYGVRLTGKIPLGAR